MRIERLREKHSPEMLAEIYDKPHDHRRFPDHELRVSATIDVGVWLMMNRHKSDVTANPWTIADLSCGNAQIARGINDLTGNRAVMHLGDFAPGYDICGPIEETIDQIPFVDLFILSETIEHVDDPGLVLSKIRHKTRQLVLSTPIDETLAVDNREHYWGWDVEGIHSLLGQVGFEPITRADVNFYEWMFPYRFQIWGCQ